MFRRSTLWAVATALILTAGTIAPTAAHAGQAGATIERPSLGLTVGAIAQLAGVPTSAQTPAHALVISTQRNDLSAEEAGRLATGQNVPGVTVVRSARDTAPSSTVGSLTSGKPATSAKYFHFVCVLYPGSTFCCIPMILVWLDTLPTG